MEGRKTVVVTGSNKGIGFALAESLAKEAQWHVIMACRNTKLGQESLNKIKDGSPNASIELAELDVSST
jgi:NAD(P)-dependent dehydrogenase (short-subunit alcohol dehydrogenase family)